MLNDNQALLIAAILAAVLVGGLALLYVGVRVAERASSRAPVYLAAVAGLIVVGAFANRLIEHALAVRQVRQMCEHIPTLLRPHRQPLNLARLGVEIGGEYISGPHPLVPLLLQRFAAIESIELRERKAVTQPKAPKVTDVSVVHRNRPPSVDALHKWRSQIAKEVSTAPYLLTADRVEPPIEFRLRGATHYVRWAILDVANDEVLIEIRRPTFSIRERVYTCTDGYLPTLPTRGSRGIPPEVALADAFEVVATALRAP